MNKILVSLDYLKCNKVNHTIMEINPVSAHSPHKHTLHMRDYVWQLDWVEIKNKVLVFLMEESLLIRRACILQGPANVYSHPYGIHGCMVQPHITESRSIKDVSIQIYPSDWYLPSQKDSSGMGKICLAGLAAQSLYSYSHMALQCGAVTHRSSSHTTD